MAWYNPFSWGQDDPNKQLGQPGNPSNYNTGPNQQGFGGPGQIFGGGQVPLGSLNLPYFQQDRDRLQGLLSNQTPFASPGWDDLLIQLKQRASGQNSLAQQNYRMASQDTTNALSSMARGSATPGAAREAMIQQGRVGQGQAAGLALAGTQEQMAAQQALGSVLGARDQINQNAYLNILSQQLGLSQGQLKAGMANQQFELGNAETDQRDRAAKMAAIAAILGTAAKAAGGGP